jgi:putative pyruvate formate lyase activating enzyme
LIIDEHGLAIRGLLVRHLILPNGLAGTAKIIRFLAEEISKETYLNLMDQYRPDFNAQQFPELDRRPTREEYAQAVKQTRTVGLYRLDQPRSHLW